MPLTKKKRERESCLQEEGTPRFIYGLVHNYSGVGGNPVSPTDERLNKIWCFHTSSVGFKKDSDSCYNTDEP